MVSQLMTLFTSGMVRRWNGLGNTRSLSFLSRKLTASRKAKHTQKVGETPVQPVASSPFCVRVER